MNVDNELATLRRELETVDRELVERLARRLTLAARIGKLKQRLGRPVLDPEREAQVARRAAELAREHDVDPELVRDVIRRIISHARTVQER